MYTFKKEERLCSKKLLEELFNNGSSFLLYPFRVSWLPSVLNPDIPVQVVINVSKRKFKRAADRNLLKRRIREAYRLNKGELLYSFLQKNNLQIILSINYVGNEILEYVVIEKKLKAAFDKLRRGYNEDTLG
jgi:ribonuclease P protein component